MGAVSHIFIILIRLLSLLLIFNVIVKFLSFIFSTFASFVVSFSVYVRVINLFGFPVSMFFKDVDILFLFPCFLISFWVVFLWKQISLAKLYMYFSSFGLFFLEVLW